MSNEEKCKNCKGSGRQVFHGAFESAVGMCNFCRGSGKYADYSQWFKDNICQWARKPHNSLNNVETGKSGYIETHVSRTGTRMDMGDV